MDLLKGYGSDSDEHQQPGSEKALTVKKQKLEIAPFVQSEDNGKSLYIPSETTKEITVNVPYSELSRPIQGPANPFSQVSSSAKNILTGYVEEQVMSDETFNTLERTFMTYKYTIAPDSDGKIIGDLQKAAKNNGAMITDIKKGEPTRKRKPKGDPSDPETFMGPWSGYENEDEFDTTGAPTEEEIAADEASRLNAASKFAGEVPDEKTIFHGREEYDYLGRTYMHAPTDLDINLHGEPGSQTCYIPKKCIHTWSGHTKGVNAIRFFPNTAHLLLSCSMDGKVKLWDVFHERQCLRTFMGHNKAVRDICFSNDGRRFLSAGYDRMIKLWDTETGKCISRFSTKRIPYCVKFNPDQDKQNIFLTGCADKKIYQFDMNSGEITQEYDQHLGAVNTITFIDENRRFVTTSDDKTLRAWEFDIPVVIKYIAEPDMHSMPAVTLSPNKKWLACQSLDNQILIYSAKDRIRLNTSKSFRGHLVAGYACQPSFSPDERFISSGDSTGKVWFWDWKTCRVVTKFKAHNSVVMGCEWHPHETSKVATCSWDGTIKYWD